MSSAVPSTRKFWARNMKRIVAILLALLLCGCSAKTPDAALTLSVSCASVLEQTDAPEAVRALVPEDGILFSESVEFASGEDLLTIFLRAMRESEKNLPAVHEITPGTGSAYITSVGGIATGDCGPMSGWTFTMNGEYPTVGCESIFPKDGDVVEWIYICEWNE